MIKKAAYEGQMQAQNELIRYLSEIAQNTRETANKQFGITQNDIGKAARNYARDYTTRTGRPAYSF